MPGLFLIAHAPLASALKAVAEHTFPDCASQLAVLDVTPDMTDRFEIEVDTTAANEKWHVEVEENLAQQAARSEQTAKEGQPT